LQNVISNAINAISEDGVITISAEYSEKNELKISVKDNGCGIPEEILDNLFKPFITSDKSGKGTGLGLWITKMMVDRMGGTITIESTPMIGTEITIRFPEYSRKQEKQ